MNSASSSHQVLLQLPLFQGMTQTELHELAAHTRFHFRKFDQNATIIKEGEICKDLFFLLQGDIEATTPADDHSYHVTEWLSSPAVLQPERLFGLSPSFTATFIAKTPCSVLSIDKEGVDKFIESSLIFRINFLNILSMRAQKLGRYPWKRYPQTLRARIIGFFEEHLHKPSGEKRFAIKMTTLAKELNEQRLNISKELNALQNESLLQMSRGIIRIPSFEKLLQNEVSAIENH